MGRIRPDFFIRNNGPRGGLKLLGLTVKLGLALVPRLAASFSQVDSQTPDGGSTPSAAALTSRLPAALPRRAVGGRCRSPSSSVSAGGEPAMTSAQSKVYSDDVSLVVIVVDTNPFFWASAALPFADFFAHLIHFVNSLLLLNHLNHVVAIAAGVSSCAYIFDSGDGNASGAAGVAATFAKASRKVEEFIAQDTHATASNGTVAAGSAASLLSGTLSLALCYIQRIFRSGIRHPQPRILCLQGSPDGPEQYVAVMNSIFSAQRSMVPIDSCIMGTQDSAFLQQASYITGGVYLKPQEPSGLFQYLAAVFATDLHSRSFLRLPKTLGVDFRASCFCHKKTIDMGYVCSVCLSIFCKYHKKCSTCGSEFNRVMPDLNSMPDQRQ